MKERDEALKKVHDDVAALAGSALAEERRNNHYLPVVGEGNDEAKIMFIGEAPGANEAKTGRPFVGAAGKVLNKLLESVGITREEVYITSIVKDRPPQNRDPRPEEIALYAPFLDRQITIIKPQVVVTLGRFAMEYVMTRYGLEEKMAPIGTLHGQLLQATSFKLLPLYHPAAAIYNRKLLATLEADFQVLKDL
jgi:uracil-DNA glycosylase family 4